MRYEAFLWEAENHGSHPRSPWNRTINYPGLAESKGVQRWQKSDL